MAGLASALEGVRFAGIAGYEGHASPIEDPGERAARTKEAISSLAGVVETIRAEGIEVETVSAGGTTTYLTAGAEPLVTQLQAGAYALMDVARHRLMPEFEIALWVGATVISRQGEFGVLDCGHKAVSSLGTTAVLAGDWGRVTSLHEEHLCFEAVGAEPRVGEKARVLPGFGPMTINLHDRLYVLAGDTVVEEWRVAARR